MTPRPSNVSGSVKGPAPPKFEQLPASTAIDWGVTSAALSRQLPTLGVEASLSVGPLPDTGHMWWDEQLRSGPSGPIAGELCVLPAAPIPAATPRTQSPSRAEQQPGAVQAAYDPWRWWWNHARNSAKAFLAGHNPPEIAIFGPVLGDDEDGLLEADVTLSFLYGGDGTYTRSDYLVVGRPAVMVGALAVNAAINRHRKVAARRDAQPSWCDHQRVHLWSTTERLIWDVGSGLASLWYGDVSGFYPELDT